MVKTDNTIDAGIKSDVAMTEKVKRNDFITEMDHRDVNKDAEVTGEVTMNAEVKRSSH
jgi:hypothetical protein